MSQGKIIHMVSGPRNISTAMLYAFDNRGDCLCYDEPFYARFLKENPDIDHPGRQDVLKSLSSSTKEIFSMIHESSLKHETVFIKNMAHHLEDGDATHWDGYQHLVLVRDPSLVLTSYAKVIARPTLEDIGIRQLTEFVARLDIMHQDYCIVDTDKFLLNPEAQMTKICQSLNLPYLESSLTWSAGSRSIDGVWAPYWYNNVHQSTGFGSAKDASQIVLPRHLQEIYKAAFPLYLKLRQKSL